MIGCHEQQGQFFYQRKKKTKKNLHDVFICSLGNMASSANMHKCIIPRCVCSLGAAEVKFPSAGANGNMSLPEKQRYHLCGHWLPHVRAWPWLHHVRAAAAPWNHTLKVGQSRNITGMSRVWCFSCKNGIEIIKMWIILEVIFWDICMLCICLDIH